MDLSEAQAHRRARVEQQINTEIAARLEAVGLTEERITSLDLGTANVSPADLKKLQPILRSLAKEKHPFTVCMRNLRDEQPTWSDDRRKKTCNVLKQLIGRKQDRQGLSESESNACALVDEGVARLLELADPIGLAELGAIDELAVLTAKARKSMAPGEFVFPKQRRYPIHDRAHAANALARSKGKPEEARVKAAVCKRFSDLPECKS